MNRYYSIIVGENVELGRTELETLISIKTPISDSEWIGRVFLFNAVIDPTDFITSRAAHVRDAGEVITEFGSIQELYHEIRNVHFDDWINTNQSFSVRHACFIKDGGTNIKASLSVFLGRIIKNQTGARVDLDTPDIRFQVIILSNSVILCRCKVSRLRRELIKRTPGRKPWFHPSMMNSIVARSMCNLAKVMTDETVLDPFCGGGGILCEAAIIGARVIGIDLTWKFIKGAEINLDDIDVSRFTLIQSDARHAPISNCNRIVTDPPYGRVSSTRGENSIQLLWDFLTYAPDIVSKGGTLCLSASSEMRVSNMVDSLGFKRVCKVSIQVHRGLTREIVVVEF